MKHIISPSNPEVKDIVRLHDKKARTEHGLFIVEGLKNIQTFCHAGWQPEHLYLTDKALETAHEIMDQSRAVVTVSDAVMKKMSASTTASGILALFSFKPQELLVQAGSLVLAEVSDPGNMGTLIRTAAALACPSVIVVGGTDPFSPKVIQAGAGAHASIPVITAQWPDVVKKTNGLSLCALVVEGGATPDNLDLTTSVLVVGSEAHGIRKEWVKACKQRLTLPMPGNTESLNAAVAGSIALYERYRRVKP
jgi:TrmH family RNA methyltransferase